MKSALKVATTLSVLSAVTLSSAFLFANSASAQTAPARGMEGSYVGAGVAAGVSNGGEFGGNIQGRVDIPSPVSVRGSVLFSDDNSAIMPILTYDVPVTRNTNVYAGAGYSFVENDGGDTPLGTADSVVLTTGVESAVWRDLVLYGDVKLGIDAFQNSSDSAVSFQAGAGYRF
jgi:hypothetical protein